MSRWSIAFVVAVCACGHAPPAAPPALATPEAGRHHDQVAAQVKPFFDAELVSGMVIGLYDIGKLEVYGFGAGPKNAEPDGNTLFEIGPVTKVYTNLLFADAVQRREVDLDTPVAELVPPGVTVPVRDKVAITLKQLALHTSGLPRIPPSLFAKIDEPDPYAKYGEDMLYNELIGTQLETTPGSQLNYSNYGAGLLGHVLGRKLGGGYAKVLTDRVLTPLGLKDTFVVVPAAAAARRATGTNDDLKPAAAWTFDALAGAAALVSTAHDQLALIDAELDAADGGARTLRKAMKLTQEPQFDRTGDNESFGWFIDSAGRYWHNGSTGGYHAFVSFDPKTKHGVVILASTATSLVDRLSDVLYTVLDNPETPPATLKFPAVAELTGLVGTYELNGTKLKVFIEGKRLYIEAPGETRRRMCPLSDHEFWLEGVQTAAVFEKSGDKVTRVVFAIGGRTLAATRVD